MIFFPFFFLTPLVSNFFFVDAFFLPVPVTPPLDFVFVMGDPHASISTRFQTFRTVRFFPFRDFPFIFPV